MSPAAQSIIQRLDAARQTWWLFTLLTTTVLAASFSLGTLLVLMLTDAYLQFSQPALAAMLLGWLAVTVSLVVIVVRRLVRNQRSLEATARRVEAECPDLGSNLINLVQLAEDVRNENRAFCQAAVHQAASQIGQRRFETAVNKESRWRRFLYCMQTPRDLTESSAVLGLLIAIAVLCHLLIPNWGSAAKRLMTPWKFVPSVGRVEIVEVIPSGNEPIEVMVGGSLDISAAVRNPGPEPYKAVLLITPEGEEESALPMSAGEIYTAELKEDGQKKEERRRRYKLTLSSILKPLSYRIEIGDSQTRVFHVGVRQKPTVDEVEVTLQYPSYLGRVSETFVQRHADLEAPQYTMARLKIRPMAPVTKGRIQLGQQPFTGQVEPDGMAVVIDEVPLVENGTFTIHLFDKDHTDPDPRVNRIRVLPDKPPAVRLVKPPRQSTAAPGTEVPVTIRAGDDYGLGEVRLEMKITDGGSATEDPTDEPLPEDESAEADPPAAVEVPATVVRQWTKFDNDTSAEMREKIVLDPKRIRRGQTVLIYAVARDRRSFTKWNRDLKPQETTSTAHVIRIVAQQEHSKDALQQIDGLRAAIWKILEKQIRARVYAAGILGKQQLAERTALAGEVRAQQVGVQKDSIVLVKSIASTDRKERLQVKQVLGELAFGEMLAAVQQCDALTKLKAPDGFDRPVPELNAVQDRVIAALRKLLDVTRQAQSDVLAEMKQRPGGDLPDDAQAKLQELTSKLDEALKQQKKVVEAAENLAKAPVEDFSEKKEQLLEAMAAAEDDWSKFMNELNTDLSKLPEQDFANALMLKELVEIQTEIKMAEDAMLKKTADIAVPLEQLGAEMAEEIQTNLEKWLPDTPDRERWSQEESLTDQDKEAPMAELPGELEDLIGELMEEEEDLFDEMEDVSSSAADSLDKGAGWDVADGPISNMSAKGATGNRLPNTSEIGGRAGEGRSGKSSGEFVGDEAIGKGGRKTPSRLTPDPYVKGQIKDHSKDPTGGASGGGKESGQGGEGLEGPAAGGKNRNLQRLAGKQAALRNKAEGIELQFQVTNFHQTDFQKLIEMMAEVERDLAAGRYQNALRQREVVLGGLGDVKQYVEGEFEVRLDTSANLPADVHKEILGSMDDPSPPGWEELNRDYFERLSTGGAAMETEPAASP